MLRTKYFKLAIFLICLMGTSIVSSGQKVSSERLPTIEDFTVTFLEKPTATGNAIISIKFSGDVSSSDSLSIQLDKNRKVTLNDSGLNSDKGRGDGIFTGEVFLSKEEILTPNLTKGGSFPVFKGREFVGEKTFPPVKEITTNTPITLNPVGNPSNIDPERSLLVRHPGVVQDSTRTRASCRESNMGKWSFGYLMTEMANESRTGLNPSDFTLNWLKHWASDQTINSFIVGNRAAGVQQLIDNWAKLDDGRLDLSRAPFRLLAIVNRTDLRGQAGYGQAGNSSGELRFVFGRVDCGRDSGGGGTYRIIPVDVPIEEFPDENTSGTALLQTVIFEFGVDSESCEQTQEWAKRWKRLDQFVLGSAEYNAELEILTEEVVRANASPRKPNGSALNQLRTNDFVFARPWELREFRIADGRSDGDITEDTIKQTPDVSFNGSSTLTQFINTEEANILAEAHNVPEIFNGSPFLGGAIEYNASDFWNSGGINNNNARHLFSLATCNACHGGESNTFFTHVDPVPFGNVTATLSGFLRGSTPSTTDIEFFPVNDPVVSTTTRKFNDLLRRATDLDAFINNPCSLRFAINTNTNMTH